MVCGSFITTEAQRTQENALRNLKLGHYVEKRSAWVREWMGR